MNHLKQVVRGEEGRRGEGWNRMNEQRRIELQSLKGVGRPRSSERKLRGEEPRDPEEEEGKGRKGRRVGLAQAIESRSPSVSHPKN